MYSCELEMDCHLWHSETFRRWLWRSPDAPHVWRKIHFFHVMMIYSRPHTQIGSFIVTISNYIIFHFNKLIEMHRNACFKIGSNNLRRITTPIDIAWVGGVTKTEPVKTRPCYFYTRCNFSLHLGHQQKKTNRLGWDNPFPVYSGKYRFIIEGSLGSYLNAVNSK